MREPSWLVRIVECFSNETDELIGEFVLLQVKLAELQRLWTAPPTDPMVEYFSIQETQAHFFRSLAGIAFDFAQYSYFLTAYATDLEVAKGEGGYMGLLPSPRELTAFPEARRVMPKTIS